MLTPAQKHLMRLQAKKQSSEAASEFHPDTSAYDLMRAKLANDKRALKRIESLELKIAKKRELIPDYSPWVTGVLESDNTFNDDVFMHILLWNLDIGDLTAALPMAKRAIEMKWSLNDSYKRKTPTMIAEEVADTALKLLQSEQFEYSNELFEFNDLLLDCDMPDEVRAKLHKALALASDDNQIKLTHLKRALALDERSGVKKLIESVEREIRIPSKMSVNHTTSGAESDNSGTIEMTQPTADNTDGE